jgi:hypothetical protein
MNKEDTKKLIEVMQAYVDGADIECSELNSSDWHVPAAHVWNWSSLAYRVALKPAIDVYIDVDVTYNVYGAVRSEPIEHHNQRLNSYHYRLVGDQA